MQNSLATCARVPPRSSTSDGRWCGWQRRKYTSPSGVVARWCAGPPDPGPQGGLAEEAETLPRGRHGAGSAALYLPRGWVELVRLRSAHLRPCAVHHFVLMPGVPTSFRRASRNTHWRCQIHHAGNTVHPPAGSGLAQQERQVSRIAIGRRIYSCMVLCPTWSRNVYLMQCSVPPEVSNAR